MPRWAMVIDLDKCTGCQACVIACKAENNIPFVSPEQAAMGRTISWMEIIPIVEGEYPRVRVRYIPRPCMQCDNPPCTKVCPVYATFKNEEGLVAQIYPRCIGCRYCTAACPYTVKYFNWYAPQWPAEMRACLNPDVSTRPKGVVEKCTFCHHRLQKAKEKARAEQRELREGDYVPACVQSCPAGAMFFGDLDDPMSTVAQLARSARAFRLLDDLGTEPKVIYLSEGEWYGPRKRA
ncbi:MAG: 4Fe-4S dicluster domain-containing protein [Acidobacteria bacterium]|nr:MAG: 4Fe-4S dicluster domain-containing protein [Acidobacteriota bacterium]